MAATFYLVYAAVLYIAMPPNPDVVQAPSGLVWGVRLASLVGLLLFWTVLGAAFGRLAQARTNG